MVESMTGTSSAGIFTVTCEAVLPASSDCRLTVVHARSKDYLAPAERDTDNPGTPTS